MTNAKVQVLQATRMVDFAKEVYQKANSGQEMPGFKEKRAALVADHKAISGKTSELRKVLENAEEVAKLRQHNQLNMEHFSKTYGTTPAMLDDLYQYARFQFDVGKYSTAGELLALFRTLAPDHEQTLGALWGKLASEILTQDWSNAQESLIRVKEAIEAGKGALENPALQLTHRSWLLHWSLFVYTAQSTQPSAQLEGVNRFIDLSMADMYTNAIQTTSQHLLRYATVAHVVSNQRRHPLKDLVRIIEQESGVYADPVTLFLRALYVDYDFEVAQECLKEAENVLRNDYFTQNLVGIFMENARLLVFRSYCKIHQCIDLGMMATKLGMNEAKGGNLQAEQWIVNVVRNEQDAKIDSARNQIVFSPPMTPIYQKIIEKSRALSTATALLQTNVQKAMRAK